MADPTDRRRVLVESTGRFREIAEHAYGPVAEALIDSGNRYSREQLDEIREFLRFGSELSYRRADEITEELRAGRGGKVRKEGS